LNPDEITIAEVLHPRGYASICIGKWHLGDQSVFLPTAQGFDEFFGIPYSEGMMEHWDEVCPPLPLMHNVKVIEAPVDCNTLTQRYTRHAIQFMRDHVERPFFLYLAHAMPGSIPDAFASASFKGRSKGGPWGDKVEEIDWSTGEILEAIVKLGLSKRTFVIWTSDNGAGKLAEGSRGSNLPLKGWGYSTAEAAMRVPCIMWWPGHIPAGTVCHEVATTMDLLPTFRRLSKMEPEKPDSRARTETRVIDGRDIWPLASGEADAKSPHQAFFYYYMDQLQAVRSGNWKLYLALSQKRISPFKNVEQPTLELYDLVKDLSETTNVANEHPEVVSALMKCADEARAELGDVGREGIGQRPAGFVQNPIPQIMRAE
jgi:arylsulfatase A-like enzyme